MTKAAKRRGLIGILAAVFHLRPMGPGLALVLACAANGYGGEAQAEPKADAAPKASYTAEEEQKARAIMVGKPFFDRGIGTPAEYATRLRGQANFEGAVLRHGAGPEIYARAVKKLAALHDDAEIGFAWPCPVPSADIPLLAAPPRVDGRLDEDEWRGARVWRGEYALNNPDKDEDRESEWRVAWDGERLCVGFRASDRAVACFVNAPERGESIHKGDSLELFLRPDMDDALYYEFIVNPAGALWPLKHALNVWGGYVNLADPFVCEGMEYAARIVDGGFVVEMALPLRALHGAWCRRPPRAGDEFGFILVRTNRDGADYAKSAPVPFLYDGHNVYGYIRARLTGLGE